MSKVSKKDKSSKDEVMIAYHGPVVIPRSMNAVKTGMKTLSVNIGAVSSNAGGLLNGVCNYSTLINNSPDWTSLQNVWSEYRLLALQLELYPVACYNTSATHGIIVCYPEHSNSTTTAPTSVGNALDHASAKVWSTTYNKVMVTTCRANGTDECQWTSMGTTLNAFAIKYVASTLGISYQYFFGVVRGTFEFRGQS